MSDKDFRTLEQKIRGVMLEKVSPGTEARRKVTNVGRPETAPDNFDPRSRLAKQGEIKTKIIDEADDARKIVGGKTDVDTAPHTDDSSPDVSPETKPVKTKIKKEILSKEEFDRLQEIENKLENISELVVPPPSTDPRVAANLAADAAARARRKASIDTKPAISGRELGPVSTTTPAKTPIPTPAPTPADTSPKYMPDVDVMGNVTGNKIDINPKSDTFSGKDPTKSIQPDPSDAIKKSIEADNPGTPAPPAKVAAPKPAAPKPAAPAPTPAAPKKVVPTGGSQGDFDKPDDRYTGAFSDITQASPEKRKEMVKQSRKEAGLEETYSKETPMFKSDNKFGLSDSILEAAKAVMEAKYKNEKELAAMGHPKDKITKKDVLIARGVIAKEDVASPAATKPPAERSQESKPANVPLPPKRPAELSKPAKEKESDPAKTTGMRTFEEVEQIDEGLFGGIKQHNSADDATDHLKQIHKQLTKAGYRPAYGNPDFLKNKVDGEKNTAYRKVNADGSSSGFVRVSHRPVPYTDKHIVDVSKSHDPSHHGDRPNLPEEVGQIDEISKKTAYAAYADRANDDYSKDYGEKLHGMIKKKWGDKAGEDAEAHASARHFGRGGKSTGTDRLSGIWNTSSDQMRTTKSGKINKQDTKAKASEIKSRLGSHTKAKLPEEVEQIDEVSPEYLRKAANKADKERDTIQSYRSSLGDRKSSPEEDKLRHQALKFRLGAIKREEVEIDEASYSAKAAAAGKDIGKPGKQFGKIAASAAKRYGSKEAGERVAGAVLKKLRKEDVKFSAEEIEKIEKIAGIFESGDDYGYTHAWTGTVDGKHWTIPLKKKEIDGDISDSETERRIKKHNPHLTASQHKAISDTSGEDGKYGKHHVTHNELERSY